MRTLLARGVHLGVHAGWHLAPLLVVNGVLATVPVGLAVALFRHDRRRTAVWWAGVVAFLLFLPNAPYVVTDLVHAGALVEAYSGGGSRLAPLVPLTLIAALVLYGLAAYAACLVEVDRELDRVGWTPWRVPVRAALHLLCAFGVVLGRLPRLNSWYVVTRPEAVVDGVGAVARPLAVPLVLALAVAFALGAAAVTAVARAAVARTGGLVRAGWQRVGWAGRPA